MVEQSNETNSIFWSALRISVPEERDRYLNQQCANDPKLRAQVDELLAAYPKVELRRAQLEILRREAGFLVRPKKADEAVKNLKPHPSGLITGD
jgi:hypothetical protein